MIANTILEVLVGYSLIALCVYSFVIHKYENDDDFKKKINDTGIPNIYNLGFMFLLVSILWSTLLLTAIINRLKP